MDQLIVFRDKSFCFTGTLAELKRSDAEKEVRSREGLTSDIVNEHLDFLVIGSIPSPNWKFGDYGSKINKAKGLSKKGKLKIIPESLFMTALAAIPPTDSGEIDMKILVIKYTFLLRDDDDDEAIPVIEKCLRQINDNEKCYVNVSTYPIGLFSEKEIDPKTLAIDCRFVKQLALDDDVKVFIEIIKNSFENISIKGEINWFDRTEGSATYIRLLQELKPRLQHLNILSKYPGRESKK